MRNQLNINKTIYKIDRIDRNQKYFLHSSN